MVLRAAGLRPERRTGMAQPQRAQVQARVDARIAARHAPALAFSREDVGVVVQTRGGDAAIPLGWVHPAVRHRQALQVFRKRHVQAKLRHVDADFCTGHVARQILTGQLAGQGFNAVRARHLAQVQPAAFQHGGVVTRHGAVMAGHVAKFNVVDAAPLPVEVEVQPVHARIREVRALKAAGVDGGAAHFLHQHVGVKNGDLVLRPRVGGGHRAGSRQQAASGAGSRPDRAPRSETRASGMANGSPRKSNVHQTGKAPPTRAERKAQSSKRMLRVRRPPKSLMASYWTVGWPSCKPAAFEASAKFDVPNGATMPFSAAMLRLPDTSAIRANDT
ncbi:hypothetical protein D3C71_1336810 [compost metagenome]